MRSLLLLMLMLLLGSASSLAQTGPAPKPGAASKPAPAAKPAARTVDPALKARAETMAGPFSLRNADGTRSCDLTLKADAAAQPPQAFALLLDRSACTSVPFALQVEGWTPEVGGAIRLLSLQGRTLAEFTEATGGSYEALREGDGVYFLVNPASRDETEVRPEEMIGDWDLARAPGTPICRWTLTDQRATDGAYLVTVAPGCAPDIAQFAAAAWRTQGGNLLVASSSGAMTLRFARQEDGAWGKVPERGRPLLLLRP
jgi:hypothetical protein